MFNTDNLKQTALAAIAAIVFTATAVGAAVGPARVAETAPTQVAASVDHAANVSAHG
jgi:hypothetical protein